jgi:Glycosyltransferase family 87
VPSSPTATADATHHPLALKGLRGYVWGVTLLVLAFQGVQTYQREVQDGHLGDFGRIYYAVVSWRAGGELYAPNVATPEIVGETAAEMSNVASPTWHLVVLPFTYLRPGLAFVLWVLCNVTAWAFSLYVCLREWRWTIKPPSVPLIALAIVASTLTAGAFHTGQYVGLLMVPATLAWRAAKHRKWAASGAWLGFLTSHKPFVLIFIAWLLWQRRWRSAIVSCAVLVASVACGELVFGLSIYQHWQQALREDVPAWGWLYVNASAWAPWARAFGPSPVFTHVAIPTIAITSALASATAIAGVTAWRLRRVADVDLTWSVLWSAALLISPLGWTYYLWWGAGPFGALTLHAWRDRPKLRPYIIAVGTCFILPLRTVLLGQPSAVASFTIGSIFTWALLAIWTGAVSDKRLSKSAA